MRARARARAGVLVLAVALFTLSCALWTHSSQADSEDLADAHYHIQRYAAVFDFTEEIAIRVVADSEMPTIKRGSEEFEAQGYAVRRQSGPGCELTFTDRSIRSRLALAHETCHCILDHGVLTGSGYKSGVTLKEVLRRERSVIACASWLTDESAEVSWARRKREYPESLGFAGAAGAGKHQEESIFQ